MKRTFNSSEEQVLARNQKSSKAQKRKHDTQISTTTSQEISVESGEDLRELLFFDQTLEVTKIIAKIGKLKSYFKSIDLLSDSQEKRVRQSLLRCCFEGKKKTKTDELLGPVDDLLRYWTFSTQLDNQHIYSLTANTIAALLRAISGNIDLCRHGNAICRSLLEETNLSCFEKALGARNINEMLAEPCLRLLNEILAFDGGQCAKLLYARRGTTLSNLSRLLDATHSRSRERSRTRSVALEYFITFVKLQAKKAKTEILHDRRIIKAVLQGLAHEKPNHIIELLDTIREYFLLDRNISLSDKSRFLDASLLKYLISLYRYPNQEVLSKAHRGVSQALHAFLIEYCNVSMSREGTFSGTSVDNSGEASTNKDSEIARASYDSSLGWSNNTARRGGDIVSLVSFLRPSVDTLQRDLLLHIFDLDPGMVTHYFRSLGSFSLEPKLSATWMNYIGLLLSIIQMPIPLHKLRQVEGMRAQSSLFVDHIAPSSLNRHSLTRCINHSVQLLSFLGVQLVTESFQKLSLLLKAAGSKGDMSGEEPFLDKKTILRIRYEVCQRLPDLKTIIPAFQRCAAETSLRKEALARLLRLYYAVNPQDTFREMFDISHIIGDTLYHHRSSSHTAELLDTEQLVLDHLFQIAKVIPSSRWWSRQGELQYKGD